MSDNSTSITSIKGFNHDFTCRGFKYEVGATYTHQGKVVCCPTCDQAHRGDGGFHACENPFDVWKYYPVIDDDGRFTRYAEVEQAGALSRDSDGTKVASASITIKAELLLPDFVRRAVSAIVDAVKGKSDGSSGYSAKIGSSGDSAKIGSSGYYAKIGSSGDYAQINATGKNTVIASAGRDAIVSGIDGTWISIAEYDDNGCCIGFATGCVGKNGLKENTKYRAKGGKLVEVMSVITDDEEAA